MSAAEALRIKVDGYSVAYRDAGQGTPLILLHGFLCDSRCWRQQLVSLSDQFRVIAWDAPGAGLSSDPSDAFTISDWSRCLAKFLDLLNIRQAYLLGISWGGLLALDFYRLYPARVSKLILSGIYPGWKGSMPESVCQQRYMRCERDSRLPPAELANQWAPEMFTENASHNLLKEMSEIMSDFHPLGFRLMAKSLADTDMRDFLPNVQSRTLILWADQDQRIPLSIGELLRSMIPNSTLAMVSNAGHLSNMEQPKEFNAQVRRFCLSNDPA